MIWSWHCTSPDFFYFNCCNGSCCNSANNIQITSVLEQHFLHVWVVKIWNKGNQKASCLKTIWTLPWPSSWRFILTFAMDPAAIWQICRATLCWSSIVYLFLAMNSLRKGAAKRQIAWRWIEVNPALVEEVYYNFCIGSCCTFVNDAEVVIEHQLLVII